MAIFLDGVMVSMKDGGRAQKRQDAKDQDKHTLGPAGYQEVGCGTLSFYDAEGDRLSTVHLARMPEKHKGAAAVGALFNIDIGRDTPADTAVLTK